MWFTIIYPISGVISAHAVAHRGGSLLRTDIHREGYLGVSARKLAFANMHKITSVDRRGKREGDKDIIRVAGVDFIE